MFSDKVVRHEEPASMNDQVATLRRILRECRTIAVVGLSPENIATKIHRVKKLLATLFDARGGS